MAFSCSQWGASRQRGAAGFEDIAMLGWALAFLVLALIAAYMGFYGLAGMAAVIAKLLLVVFLILLVVSAFSGALRGRPPQEP
jgi:uncharacterized membrane protein YtjA (UPF0391 family)